MKRKDELEEALKKKFGVLYKKTLYDERVGNGYTPSETGTDGDLYEVPAANPNQLGESAGLWYKPPLSEMEDDQMDSVKAVYAELTKRQKEIYDLVLLEGKTFEHTADRLGITKGSVQTTIERIKKRIQKHYCLTSMRKETL